jgi:PAS domain S-box-containing protein
MVTGVGKLNVLANLIKRITEDATMSVLMDINGNVIFVNKGMAEFLGRKPEKIIGKNWVENFVPVKYRGKVQTVLRDMVNSNILSSERYINPVLTINGDEKIVYWQNGVVRDEQGKISHVVSYGENITDRRQLEKALLLSERDKAKILNSLLEPVIYQDRDHRILWLNNAASESVTDNAEKVVGQRCYTAFHKRDTPCIECPVNEAKKTGKPSEAENTRYDGRIFHIRAYPVFGDNKQITGAIEISSDITEQEKAGKKLRESERKYHLLADNIADVIVVFDMSLNMTYVSPSATALFGYDSDDLLSITMEDALPAEEFKKVSGVLKNEMGQAAAGQKAIFSSKTLVVKVYKKDRSIVPVEARLSFLRDEKGAPIGILGVARDISERQKAEQDLIKSYQKLQRALESSVNSMAIIGEMRDPYTAGHQRRVMGLAVAIARQMKMSEEMISAIRIASIVHDIGKISVPAEILSKPGKLNEMEFNIIKSHPKMGYDILSTIEFLYPIAEIVYQHHERMDGSGYPRGLRGNEIIIEARVLMVADVVEAMASHRPYREALGIDKALAEIKSNKGILYDEHVVDACVFLFEKRGFKFEQVAMEPAL